MHHPQVWARCRAVAVAQVLEYGIAAHSVIIGIALGVSSSSCTIRPLAAALVFHQMFEGIALGATLISAGYHGCVLCSCQIRGRASAVMAVWKGTPGVYTSCLSIGGPYVHQGTSH